MVQVETKDPFADAIDLFNEALKSGQIDKISEATAVLNHVLRTDESAIKRMITAKIYCPEEHEQGGEACQSKKV